MPSKSKSSTSSSSHLKSKPIPVPLHSSTDEQHGEERDEEDNDDDDDDEAPEEESNSTAKEGANMREKELKLKKDAETQKRAKASKAKENRALALKALKAAEAEAEEEARIAADDTATGENGEDEEFGETESDESDGSDQVNEIAEDQEVFDVSEDDLDADLDEPSDKEDEVEDEDLPSSKSQKTNHLDPSLFASLFSTKPSNITGPKSILKGDTLSASQKKELRKKGLKEENKKLRKEGKKLVRGRDGEGIRRLGDGRTIVRSLSISNSKSNFDDLEESQPSKVELPKNPLPPLALDPTLSLPNARSRAFKKRVLGLNPKAKKIENSLSKKVKKTKDDPLGLEDPEFMKGGEFTKKSDGEKKRKREEGGGMKGFARTRRGEGGRKVGGNGMVGLGGRNGQAGFGFNTSG